MCVHNPDSTVYIRVYSAAIQCMSEYRYMKIWTHNADCAE